LREGQRDLVDRLHLDQGASLGERRKRGEHEQAIGRSRGGRTTKIHALSDPDCRPCAFHLTPGQDADIAAAPALLALAPPMRALIADKGYDGDGFRADVIRALPEKTESGGIPLRGRIGFKIPTGREASMGWGSRIRRICVYA
jgi:transposase